jgi:hypothetical protein
MSDIPRWQAGELDEPGEDIPGVEKLFKNLPITIHLGDPKLNTIIGWSNAWRNEDGTSTIVMSLTEEDSEKLGNLVETHRLWVIGFAGVPRKEQPQ